MPIEKLKQVWPEWTIEKQLGKGSYGIVYKAVRRDHNLVSYAAIKVISIPQDPSEIDSLRSEGLDLNGTRTYLQEIVNSFVGEIQLMESLKGVQNIVNVEDYKVVEKTGEIGWDIFIRMELLTPFNAYVSDKKLSEADVIMLGIDICTALEICSKRNIIHRDVKPENIFVNDFGYFKLGDFGIARKLENITGLLSQKGTFNYMAPEVASSSCYDARVDIYSLGIVLYKLLNDNRLPFLDSEKQLLNPNDRRIAVERRIRGESLPAPRKASPEMQALILRACAYDPNQRFTTASEMKKALEDVENGDYVVVPVDTDATTAVRHASSELDSTTAVRRASYAIPEVNDKHPGSFGKKKSSAPKFIVAIAAAAIVIVGAAISVPMLLSDKDQESQSPVASPVAMIEKENDPTETVDFSESDETQIAEILRRADTLAEAGDYEGAATEIQEGLSTYGNSDELSSKLDEYNSVIMEQERGEGKADGNNSVTAKDSDVSSTKQDEYANPTPATKGEENETGITENITLKSISVYSPPSKTNYTVGDNLDATGLSLTAVYSDGSIQAVNRGFICTPTSLNNVGTQLITVSYNGASTSFNVTVNTPVLNGISVNSLPYKTSYSVGDTLVTAGLSLLATYSNGSTQIIDSGFACNPTALNSAGTQKIIVTYADCSTGFDVTVEQKQPMVGASISTLIHENSDPNDYFSYSVRFRLTASIPLDANNITWTLSNQTPSVMIYGQCATSLQDLDGANSDILTHSGAALSGGAYVELRLFQYASTRTESFTDKYKDDGTVEFYQATVKLSYTIANVPHESYFYINEKVR